MANIDPDEPRFAAAPEAGRSPTMTHDSTDLGRTPQAAGRDFQPDDRFYQVEPSWVTLRRLRASILVLVVWSAIAAVVAIVSTVADPPRRTLNFLWGAWLLTAAGAVSSILILPALAYRRLLYRVNDTRLQIRRGYLWRTVHDVPRSRIQHIDIGQGPLERTFDLTHVIVHTAGTASASVQLEGLREDVATRLRDVLLVERGDDAV